jgi:hypothetical protein
MKGIYVMKRFIVEQLGYVQMKPARRLLVEVPDHFTKEQAEELLQDAQSALPSDGLWWTDDLDCKWDGFDVEIEEIWVYDPEIDYDAPPVISLIDGEEVESSWPTE